MATDEEIVVKLTAQTAQLKAGMAEGAAVVKTTQDEMAASFKNSTASFAAFDAIEKANLRTAEQVAQAQKVINDVQATGAFTSEELAAKQTLVSAAMAKVEKDSKGAAIGIAAITSNSRSAYTVSALLSDAMTGQFSRSRREVAALANETGVMSAALRLAISPVGILAAGIVALGVAAAEAGRDMEEMQRTIVASGNFAGTTGDQMATMAQRMANGGEDIESAAQAIEALVASGQVAGPSLETASRGVVDFAAVTKSKMGEAVNEFVKLGRDPVKESAKLNESFNYLTKAEFDNINALEKQGKTSEAASAAQAALANAMHGRAVQMADYASQVEVAWKKAWGAVSGHGEIQESEAAHTMQTRMAAITQELDFLAAHGNRENNTLAPGGVNADPVGAQYVAQLKTELANLKAQLALVNGAAAAQGNAAAEVRDHIDKALHGGKGGGNSKDDEQAFQQAQYAAQQQGHELSLAEQKTWWQKRLATDQAGGDADANAAAAAMRHVVELQKEMDNKAAQSGQQAARKRAQAAKEEARKEEEAAKQAAQAKLAFDEQAVDNAHNAATARVHAAMEGYADDAAAGKITAAQLLADQQTALKQQLAADIVYYQGRAQLAAGDKAEVSKWNAAIVVDKIKTNAELLALDKRYQAELRRIRQEATDEKIRDDQREIMSGMREVNALIAHQETWRQAVGNIGMQVLEQQERDIAKGIAEAINGENAKTAATEMGTAERLALNAAAEVKALAIQGEAAVKWIMTEAAKAAAGAFNALVSIPYVGPVLAVGASIAAFAAVSKLVSSVASAEGGWERVPADGMQTILHKDEMVLPARIAEPMRQTFKNGAGGAGGTHHYYVTAIDAPSLLKLAKRHPAVMSQAIRHAARNGYR